MKAAGGAPSDQLVLMCIASLETMTQILQNWDFRKKLPAKLFNSSACIQSGQMSLRPGKEWRPRLLGADGPMGWVYVVCPFYSLALHLSLPIRSKK